jgi:glycosyltransferase involved in cell wall biosynthesis
MRVALVHDWLTGMRGGEKCLAALCELFPQADLYTLLHLPGSVSPIIENRTIHTSWLQRLPDIGRHYRYFLPLMPLAIETFRLSGYDLVVSSSHCVAKGIRPPHQVPHICYCHTPMRYAWNLRDAYFTPGTGLKAQLLHRVLDYLRDWDQRSANRVSHYVANSQTVQDRIRESYGRASVVVYPPVDVEFYTAARRRREDYYLVISAFAPYKRVDLAIQACNQLGRHLMVIGSGQEEARLRSLAGPTIHFTGWQPDEAIRDHFRRCRAMLFPGEEDFGITPVEANACGTPVIAFGRGGATETLLPLGASNEPTGLFFEQQSVECLAQAMIEFERARSDFDPAAAQRQAQRFSRQRYLRELREVVAEVMGGDVIPERAHRRAA